MNSFDVSQLQPDSFSSKDVWLVPCSKTNSIFIKPKPQYTGCAKYVLWLGRTIQALLAYRSNTHQVLQQIRTVFVKTLENKEVTGTATLNIKEFNGILEKYNKNQWWKRCKIDLINVNEISNGNFKDQLIIPELINKIGSFLDLKDFRSFKSTCKDLDAVDSKDLVGTLRLGFLISRCHSKYGSFTRSFYKDLFCLLIEKHKICNIDALLAPFRSNEFKKDPQLQALLKWSSCKVFDKSFDQLIKLLLGRPQFLTLNFGKGWPVYVNLTDFTNYLRALLLYSLDENKALAAIGEVPSNLRIFLLLSLAEVTKNEEKKNTLIKAAEDLLLTLDMSWRYSNLAYYKRWCRNNGMVFSVPWFNWNSLLAEKVSSFYYEHLIELTRTKQEEESLDLAYGTESIIYKIPFTAHRNLENTFREEGLQKVFSVVYVQTPSMNDRIWEVFINKHPPSVKFEAAKLVFASNADYAIGYLTPQMFSAAWSRDKEIVLKWSNSRLELLEKKSISLFNPYVDNAKLFPYEYSDLALLALSHTFESET